MSVQNKNEIEVREIQSKDIQSICDYWMNSSPYFLKTLGVDISKMPSREAWEEMLKNQLESDYSNKKSYVIIAHRNNEGIGHCNVNEIAFGKHAKMHLHIWDEVNRKMGFGSKMISKAIPNFFKNLQLHTLYCEPYAHNIAPNRTLEKLGFEFVKKYRTIPGSLSFEQEVNQWKISKKDIMRTGL